MPTNANTFNSRVTSEALEAKFRQVFPAQGGAELVQDLFASGVIQPVVDFSTVAEGSVLPESLQYAWDFATGSVNVNASGTTNVISNTGFWLCDLSAATFSTVNVAPKQAILRINDGSSTKPVWGISTVNSPVENSSTITEARFVVFLRAGDNLEFNLNASNLFNIDMWYRQVADVNGTLVNPLGFTFS